LAPPTGRYTRGDFKPLLLRHAPHIQGLCLRILVAGAARDQASSDGIGMMHTKRSNYFRTRRASGVGKRFYFVDFCLLDF
jgi:hypothetical protein